MTTVNAKAKPGANKEQQECIETKENKFLVIAGPGTGKTYTVSQRIKYLIEQKNTNPKKILCLTFSETAAREMREKAGKDYPIQVYTFHSFCWDIIRNNIDDFGLESENLQVIQDFNKRNFINECIEEINEKKHLVGYNNEINNPYVFIKEIDDGIEEIKRNRIKKEQFFYNLENSPLWTPRLEKLEQLIKKYQDDDKAREPYEKQYENLVNSIQKMKELWDLYELFEEKKKQNGFIDYADMINAVLNEFDKENSKILKAVANSYDYVLVDEYQDTNSAQNELVFKLAKFCPNIFVVGDDDQIIYRFQGAHIDTIENFIKEFDLKAENISCLKQNYRSTENILKVAMAMANIQNKFPTFKNRTKKKDFPDLPLRLCSKDYFKDLNIDKTLSASNKDIAKLNKNIEFLDNFYNKNDEINKIVNIICDIINPQNTNYKTPEKLSEIAVLTTKNDDLYEFEKYFKQKNIKVEFVKGKNIFNIETIVALIAYMQFLCNPVEYYEKMFLYFLMEPFNINPDDYITIKENCKKETVIEDIQNILKNNTNTLKEPQKFEEFTTTYKKLKKYIEDGNYKNALLKIYKETGLEKNANIQLYDKDVINRGYNQLENEATCFFNMHKGKSAFAKFVKYITNLMNSDIEILTEKNEKPENAIQLTTYHSSKGREFEYVFMPDLYGAKWENKNSSQKNQVLQKIPLNFDKKADYDTIKEKIDSDNFLDLVKLLYVGITRAKHTLYFTKTKTYKSWFFKQLEKDLDGTELIQIKDNPAITEYIIVPKKYDYQKFKKAKLPTKFSPSALNSYLINCPRQYFYKYILGLTNSEANLIYGDSSPFGTAVHETFEDILKYAKENKAYPKTVEEVLAIFDEKLEKQHFNHFNEIKERGYKLFKNYYEKFKNLANPETTEFQWEKSINYTIPDETGDIILYGKADRLDIDENGNYSLYDYKTGINPEGIERDFSKNHSNYYYQMGIYKYILEENGHNVIRTCFLYPEIDEETNKKNHQNKTDVDIPDFEEIKEDYVDSVKGIRNFDFEIPEKPKCNYCNYTQWCKKLMIV